jgi:thiol-disulfide isomerase/thioredoxin
MDAGWWVLTAVVGLAAVIGVTKRWYDGRIRPQSPTPLPDDAEPAPLDRDSRQSRLTGADLDGAALGERATLVHFSSAFCAPCRATRQVLAQVSEAMDGVDHVEIDAESRLELVRRLNVRRTPTVLVLDSDGRIRARASGPPRRVEVVAAVEALGSRDNVS